MSDFPSNGWLFEVNGAEDLKRGIFLVVADKYEHGVVLVSDFAGVTAQSVKRMRPLTDAEMHGLEPGLVKEVDEWPMAEP